MANIQETQSMKEIKEHEDLLFERISALIEQARNRVKTVIDTTMVYTYYGVGQYIMDFEQNGDYRAAYGKGVLNRLSAKLTGQFGRGCSVDTLENCRKFYRVYSISLAKQTKSETAFRKSNNRHIALRRKKRRLSRIDTSQRHQYLCFGIPTLSS